MLDVLQVLQEAEANHVTDIDEDAERQKIRDMYQQAVSGEGDAQLNIGMLYEENGILEKALHWYRKAALQENYTVVANASIHRLALKQGNVTIHAEQLHCQHLTTHSPSTHVVDQSSRSSVNAEDNRRTISGWFSSDSSQNVRHATTHFFTENKTTTLVASVVGLGLFSVAGLALYKKASSETSSSLMSTGDIAPSKCSIM